MAEYQDSGLSGDVNWAAADLPFMWNMVRDHDSAPYQQALDGWRRSYELVLMHRTQVETYKDKLIQAWPPDRNQASRAYIERLDHLIDSLTETYEAAIANHTTFSSAIAAVSAAKVNVQPLQEEYEKNKVLLAQHEEDVRSRPTRYTPPKSPVADTRQAQLQQQAALIMTSVSAELAMAQTSLVIPKPYSQPIKVEASGEGYVPGGGGAGIPTTGSPISGRSSSRIRPSNAVISHPDMSRDITAPDRNTVEQPINPRNPSDGPILGGAKPNPNSPNPGIPTTPTTTPTVPPNNFSPGPHNFTPTPSPTPSTSLPRYPSTNKTSVGTLPPSGPTGSRGNAVPHGVIGGSPAVGGPIGGPGSGRGGQSGTLGRGGTQKANPVGGMIGQGGVGGPSQRRPSRNSEEAAQHRRWDPDNPWETDSGTEPVLRPSPEQRIDPGPTIGGR